MAPSTLRQARGKGKGKQTPGGSGDSAPQGSRKRKSVKPHTGKSSSGQKSPVGNEASTPEDSRRRKSVRSQATKSSSEQQSPVGDGNSTPEGRGNGNTGPAEPHAGEQHSEQLDPVGNGNSNPGGRGDENTEPAEPHAGESSSEQQNPVGNGNSNPEGRGDEHTVESPTSEQPREKKNVVFVVTVSECCHCGRFTAKTNLKGLRRGCCAWCTEADKKHRLKRPGSTVEGCDDCKIGRMTVKAYKKLAVVYLADGQLEKTPTAADWLPVPEVALQDTLDDLRIAEGAQEGYLGDLSGNEATREGSDDDSDDTEDREALEAARTLTNMGQKTRRDLWWEELRMRLELVRRQATLTLSASESETCT